ncbi:MAG: tyrosine-type recombinase/integrase [Clostridia bacterium]
MIEGLFIPHSTNDKPEYWMMQQKNTFQTGTQIKYVLKIRAILRELPMFCSAFFRSIENNTSVLTRYAYAIDLRGFFYYLISEPELFLGRDLLSLTAIDLEKIQACHIEMYLDQMTLYYKDEREFTNKQQAKARKLCTLRSFFKFCFKQELLSSNVASLVDLPKLHEKAIVRLEPNEVANLLDTAERGDGLSLRQKQYHNVTKLRDLAILTLFLGTGIRISELVGIDLIDVDFENDAFSVTRKGGSQDILTFGNEVHDAMKEYYDWRALQITVSGHEQAFFLSIQMKRISVRAVEILVKKYATLATPLKKITPHKLRSTYGTMLYHETQDIYLVADVLGHKDVNTTRKHYAASSEENKRIAAKKIKLRDD